MAKLSIVAGATSQSINVFIQNSTSTTGAGLTGLVYNTSGLIAYYAFTGANGGSNALSLATLAAATSAWSTGGFKEIDATNMPGLYRLDLPNAVIAGSKGRAVTLYLQGATSMAPCLLEIELTSIDNQSTGFGLVNASANVVQWNSAAVIAPNAAGVPVVDITYINGSSVAAVNLNKTTLNIGRGTVSGSPTTTSIPTSAFSLAGASTVSGQFINRIIVFDNTTATAALQGQLATITANTSGATPTFTVTALTNAPASGDTFSVL